MKTHRRIGLGILAATGLAGGLHAAGPAALELEPAMFAGKPAARVLEALPSEAEPGAAAGFARGSIELLAAVEELCQSMHRLGLDYQFARELPLPIFRIALPPHPDPEAATPEKVRAVLARFYDRLAAVDERLAALPEGEFKVVFPLGAVALDFDGNGEITEGESFARFFGNLSRPARLVVPDDPANAQAREVPDGRAFTVAFDRADASWLRAYTHLLRGVIDVWLAHDGGELFATSGHLFFRRADTEFARTLPPESDLRRGSGAKIADAIALIHGLAVPVSHPERLAGARGHFLCAAALSRVTLDAIAAESDNDREWLPGPAQTSAFGLGLTQEQADGWRRLLGEIEDLLEGRKLLPHWRFTDGRGVNLRRWLEESRRTDLVLLVQGSAVLPYLEKGELTRGETWREITRLFQGNFLGYALWIN